MIPGFSPGVPGDARARAGAALGRIPGCAGGAGPVARPCVTSPGTEPSGPKATPGNNRGAWSGDQSSSHRHGRRRPAIHVLQCRSHENVDGGPSPAITKPDDRAPLEALIAACRLTVAEHGPSRARPDRGRSGAVGELRQPACAIAWTGRRGAAAGGARGCCPPCPTATSGGHQASGQARQHGRAAGGGGSTGRKSTRRPGSGSGPASWWRRGGWTCMG